MPAPMNWPGSSKLPPGYKNTKPMTNQTLEEVIQCSQTLVHAYNAAGRTEHATLLQADIIQMKAGDASVYLHQQIPLHTGVFPPIQVPDSTNPFWDGLIAQINKLGALNSTYSVDKPSSSFKDVAKALEDAADCWFAWAHPQSPCRTSPNLVSRCIMQLDYAYSHDIKLLNEHHPVAQNIYAYLLIKTSFPNLIPQSIRTRWEDTLRILCEQIYTDHHEQFSSPTAEIVFNLDIATLAAMHHAHIIFGDEKYLVLAKTGIECVRRYLLADGALPYNNKALPVTFYTPVITRGLVMYWLVSGDPMAFHCIDQMATYYCLDIDHKVTSRSFDWAFKKVVGIHEPGGPTQRYHTAMITGNPACMDQQYFSDPYREYSWYSVILYHPNWVSKPFPDEFVIYNQNILGPHIRSPEFVTQGSAEAWDAMTGKTTFVGCVIPPAKIGIQDIFATPTFVTLEQAKTFDSKATTSQPKWFHHACENSAYTVTEEQGAVTGSAKVPACHDLKQWRTLPTESPWINQQAWILSKQYMIGLVTLSNSSVSSSFESEQQQEAMNMMVLIRVCGKYYWSTPEEAVPVAEKIEDNLYRVGNALDIAIIESDLPHVTAVPGNLTLTDRTESSLISYTAGTTKSVLLEIRPASTEKAVVQRLSFHNGLVGFEYQALGKYHQLVYNPTNTGLAYKGTSKLLSLTCSVLVWKNGSQVRPWFMHKEPDTDFRGRQPTWGSAKQSPSPIALSSVAERIPAHSHLLLVCSQPTLVSAITPGEVVLETPRDIQQEGDAPRRHFCCVQ